MQGQVLVKSRMQVDVVIGKIVVYNDNRTFTVILNLCVCILLRVLDQVQGFPSNATLFQ
jgi:chemotaxis receptor (MCP) glutamine deamidase CheD